MRDRATEVAELAVVANGQNHEAVAGREVLIGHSVGVRVAHALRRSAIQMVHALVRQTRHLHVQQREVDVLALSCPVARCQRSQDGGAGIEPREDVGECHAHLHRAGALFPIGTARDAHQATHALHQEVVARALGIGAGLAEAGDGAVDQLRVDGLQRRRVKTVLRQAADLEVLDHHVAMRCKLTHQRLARSRREIDRHRFLVAVGAKVVSRVARVLAFTVFQERRSPEARVVAGARAFDLDDLGPQVAQCLAGPGTGQHARQVQHAKVRQGARHGQFVTAVRHWP